jgi:geranylgeranyl pyrophosphate synthase
MIAVSTFAERLAKYKHAIDDDIATYAIHIAKSTRTQYGEYAGLEVDAFLDMLGRGGKRIRGALVILGYEMSGGTNHAMILQAARAIEMLHAYMLVIDDIQDRSALRRGKPTVHVAFTEYHRRHHLKGNAEHAGVGLALNAAIAGAHAAQIILANMDAEPQLKLNVLSIVNRTMAVTAHGQMYDMLNEMVQEPDVNDIDRVLEWKTALYSFINPLHVGMVLAGADCHATDAITPYGLHTGKAFQIIDDILGIFGDEKELGKSPIDDIREGKITVLMAYALGHASAADAVFLKSMLGNQQLTEVDFKRCRTIVQDSGALGYARERANDEAEKALAILRTETGRWPQADMLFLSELVTTIQKRRS